MLAAHLNLTNVLRALATGIPGLIDLQDEAGRTALMLAVEAELVNVVQTLLDLGAAIKIEDDYNMTASAWRITCEFEDIALLLLQHGAIASMGLEVLHVTLIKSLIQMRSCVLFF